MSKRSGFKYGLLIAPDTDRRSLPKPLQLASDLHWRVGDVEKLIALDEAKLWKESFGSQRWDEITREGLLVYCVRESSRADVVDGENEDLGTRLSRVATALKLVDFGVPLRGHSTVLTGEARSDAPFDILSVRHFTTHHATLSPYYANGPGFWELEDQLLRPAGEWFDQWAMNVALLDRMSGRTPESLNVGMLAYLEALRVSFIEFRIPNFVRAAEAVLALPKGGGATEFARRGTMLVADLEADPFLGTGLKERLERTYRLRNECVHGMIPFKSMQMQGADKDLEARRIEYLTERLARRALLHGLRRAHEPYFASRAALEAAWQRGAMP